MSKLCLPCTLPFSSSSLITHLNSDTPLIWRPGKIAFILKPQRPPDRPSLYRPIVLNSISGKILERLLNNRLYYFLHKNALLHTNKFGFTSAESAHLVLHQLKNILSDYKRSKTPTVLIFLDCQGAFDSVWHTVVLDFLRKHSCPRDLYYLLQTFLSSRTITYSYHLGQESAYQTTGSPQGTSISPLLWKIAVYSLLDITFPFVAHLQAYADDTVLILPGISRLELQRNASFALNAILYWATDHKLYINPTKSSFLFFNNGQVGTSHRRPSIKMANTFLRHTPCLKILGVTFDATLNFHTHIEHTRSKVETTTARFMTFIKLHHSLHSLSVLRIYRQVRLPSITYASSAWWSISHTTFLRKRVMSLQKSVLIAITGAFYTTRTSALQVISNIPPIDLQLDRLDAHLSLFIKRTTTYYAPKTCHPHNILTPVTLVASFFRDSYISIPKTELKYSC